MKAQVIKAWQWDFRYLVQSIQTLNIKTHGVIHVGAHWGEEVPSYLQCGFKSIVLVEPDPNAFNKITEQEWYDGNRVSALNLAVGLEEGDFHFHQIENGIWSGFRRNLDHKLENVITVSTVPLSTIQQPYKANVLVIDTQGTELEALQSADLSEVDLVIIETQNDGPNGYAAYWPDVVKYADQQGWEPGIIWDRHGGFTDTLLVPKR